jgi:hypothetical protein
MSMLHTELAAGRSASCKPPPAKIDLEHHPTEDNNAPLVTKEGDISH